MDAFKANARTLTEGLEPELSVAVDVMYPISRLTEAVRSFHENFPKTPLRLYVEALGAVMQPVLDGRCRIGVIGSLSDVPDDCSSEFLLSVPAVIVAAPTHALAAVKGAITPDQAAAHVQLVLTDRSPLTEGRNFAVVSPHNWRLADLGAKHAFLRAGLGFGTMPLPMVEEDLANGKLVRIELEQFKSMSWAFAMRALHRKDAPPGPAGRWFIDCLKQP